MKKFLFVALFVAVIGVVLYVVSPKFRKAVDDAFSTVKKASGKVVDSSCDFVKKQAGEYAKSRKEAKTA